MRARPLAPFVEALRAPAMSASLDPPTCDIASHEAEPAPSTSESPAACTGAEAADTIDDDDAYALGSCMPADELAEPPGKKVRMVDLGWFGYASPDDSGLYRAASSASSVYASLSMQPFSPARVDHPWTRAAWHAVNGASVVWKVHAAYDFMSDNGWQYMKHGILIACFVHERKHKMLKRYARAIRNTSRDWEQSMLAEVTDHHLAALDHEDFSFDARLVGESLKRPAADLVALLRVAFGGNADIKIASDARFSEWGVARRGDVVMIVANGVHVVGRAFLFAAIDGDIFVGVDLWTRIDATRGSSRWRVSGDRRAVLDASAILETLIWSQTLDVATVIVPPWL